MPLLFLKFLPWLLAFLAVSAVVGTGIYKLKKWGGDEVRAELQPKLDACAGEVQKHNDAAKALAAESARKQAEGAKALSKAKESARVWEDNAVRLQRVLTARKPDGDKTCTGAWSEIRKPK